MDNPLTPAQPPEVYRTVITPSPSFEKIEIDTIRNWTIRDSCHYCELAHTYRDATRVLTCRGILSNRDQVFPLCEMHAAECLIYTRYMDLGQAARNYPQVQEDGTN